MENQTREGLFAAEPVLRSRPGMSCFRLWTGGFPKKHQQQGKAKSVMAATHSQSLRPLLTADRKAPGLDGILYELYLRICPNS